MKKNLYRINKVEYHSGGVCYAPQIKTLLGWVGLHESGWSSFSLGAMCQTEDQANKIILKSMGVKKRTTIVVQTPD